MALALLTSLWLVSAAGNCLAEDAAQKGHEHAAPAADGHDHGDPDHADHDHDAHAENGANGHGHLEHKVHGKKPAPLLGAGTEFLDISWPLFFWTIVIFLVTAFLLKQFAWKPILASLDDREARIAESLRAAQEARDEARKIFEEKDAEFGRAQEEVKAILDEARQTAGKEAEALLAAAKARANESRQAAEREIEAAKIEALAELRGSAATLASAIVAKTVKKKVDPNDLGPLVEEVQR